MMLNVTSNVCLCLLDCWWFFFPLPLCNEVLFEHIRCHIEIGLNVQVD